MADFNSSKVDGDSVDANEWNQLASIDNFITTSGQTPSTSNLNQMGIGAARYASGGQFFTDSGTANAYVLTSISPFKSPVSSGACEGYFVGMTIKFRAGNANTGASTVNVNSAGVKNLKLGDGTTDLPAGTISTNADVIFRYNGTVFCLENSSFIGFRAYRSTSVQTISSGVNTKVQLNAESYDTNGWFDSTTNYRFTPLKAGYYLVIGSVITGKTGKSPVVLDCKIYKNGVEVTFGNVGNGVTYPAASSFLLSRTTTDIIYMNGSTDYLELFTSATYSDGTSPEIQANVNGVFMAATFLGI